MTNNRSTTKKGSECASDGKTNKPPILSVLVVCEESQEVCTAFRERGHMAYSCDLLPCSGRHPEWHIQDDALKYLSGGWDLIIAHPPCTRLCVSGARWFKDYQDEQKKAIDFFMEIANANCERIAIENPVGIMSSIWRKPDQIIQPWQFGDSYQKTTCLWLKNLPQLKSTKIVDKGEFVIHGSGKKKPKWYADALALPKEERRKVRSKTFPGIAQAMASQWGDISYPIQHKLWEVSDGRKE